MKDRVFLIWLHNRLRNTYKENIDLDYMRKLRSIIDTIPNDQETPNIAPTIEEVVKRTNYLNN